MAPSEYSNRQLPDQLQGHPGLDPPNCVQKRPATAGRSPHNSGPPIRCFTAPFRPTCRASAYTWSNANNQITSSPDPSQRFWKEYIDFVLGVWHDPSGNIQTPGNPACSYGPDFTAGTSFRQHLRPRFLCLHQWFGLRTTLGTPDGESSELGCNLMEILLAEATRLPALARYRA